MAGFLDKDTRVIDMIITAEGRRMMSLGRFDISSWAAFDDGVMYDGADEKIEETLVREAVAGYSRGGDSFRRDTTNLSSSLYDAKQGYTTLPRMIVTGSVEIDIGIRKIEEQFVDRTIPGRPTKVYGPYTVGYERISQTSVKLGLGVGENVNTGYTMSVYERTLDGLVDVDDYSVSGSVITSSDLVIASGG